VGWIEPMPISSERSQPSETSQSSRNDRVNQSTEIGEWTPEGVGGGKKQTPVDVQEHPYHDYTKKEYLRRILVSGLRKFLDCDVIIEKSGPTVKFESHVSDG